MPYEATLVQIESLYMKFQNDACAKQDLEMVEVIELYAQNVSQLTCLYRQFYRPHKVVELAELTLPYLSLEPLPPD